MVNEVPVILEEMLALHKEKSEGYGSDKDPLHNFNAVAKVTGEHNFHYPMVRITEKCTRAFNLIEAGRSDDLGEELKDIALLAVLAEAMRRQHLARRGVDTTRFREQLSVGGPVKARANPWPQNEALIKRDVKNPLVASPLEIEPNELSTLEDDLATSDVPFRLPDDIQNELDACEVPRPGAVIIKPVKYDPIGKTLTEVMRDVRLTISEHEALTLIGDGMVTVNGIKISHNFKIVKEHLNDDGQMTIRKGSRQEVKV